MKCIQTIKSFNQNHACKVSIPLVDDHQAHPKIYTRGPMNQEVACKDA